MAKIKIAKIGTGIVNHNTSPTDEYYVKRSKVKFTGHKVHNVAMRQPCCCCTISLWWCHHATRRSRTAVSSHENTTLQDCLIQGDGVVSISYALY